MKDLKTPLNYPGGKSRATDHLFSRENLPRREIREYREPFLGGGSCAIAFTKKFPGVPVWVNDKYFNLFCFWKILQIESEKLAGKLHEVKSFLDASPDPLRAHLDYKKTLDENLASKRSEFEIAWSFYIINKCSFSGLTEISASFSKLATSSNFNHRLISLLPKFSHLIRDWRITNLDYSELYDGDEDVFVFSDPPYDISSFVYGKGGDMHRSFSHEEYFRCVEASKNMIMITYNSSPRLRERFDGWGQLEWDLNYTMRSTRKYMEEQSDRKELLLWNYDRFEMQTLESFM